MSYFLVAVLVVASVCAEPPISKSYLPPSPNGYPQGPQGFQGTQGLQSQSFHGPQGFQRPQGAGTPGTPEVVAARSFAQGQDEKHGNNFARNNLHGSSNSEGYDAFGRNGETVGAYEFGYSVDKGRSGSADYGYEGRSEGAQFGHHEEGRSGGARGEYHVVLPDGRKQTVSYEADERGFKPHISYQDSEDFARSGYDSNARDNQNGARYHGNEHGRDLHGNGIHGGARSNGY